MHVPAKLPNCLLLLSDSVREDTKILHFRQVSRWCCWCCWIGPGTTTLWKPLGDKTILSLHYKISVIDESCVCHSFFPFLINIFFLISLKLTIALFPFDLVCMYLSLIYTQILSRWCKSFNMCWFIRYFSISFSKINIPVLFFFWHTPVWTSSYFWLIHTAAMLNTLLSRSCIFSLKQKKNLRMSFFLPFY